MTASPLAQRAPVARSDGSRAAGTPSGEKEAWRGILEAEQPPRAPAGAPPRGRRRSTSSAGEAPRAPVHGSLVDTARPLGRSSARPVQWAASVRDFLGAETVIGNGGWMDDVIVHDGPLIKNGHFALPNKPGSGVELNPDVVKAHLTKGETY